MHYKYEYIRVNKLENTIHLSKKKKIVKIILIYCLLLLRIHIRTHILYHRCIDS